MPEQTHCVMTGGLSWCTGHLHGGGRSVPLRPLLLERGGVLVGCLTEDGLSPVMEMTELDAIRLFI